MDDYRGSLEYPPRKRPPGVPLIPLGKTSDYTNNSFHEDSTTSDHTELGLQKQIMPSVSSLLSSLPLPSFIEPGYRMVLPGEPKIPFLLPDLNAYYYNPLNPPPKFNHIGFNVPPMYSPQLSTETPILKDTRFLEKRDTTVPNPSKDHHFPDEEEFDRVRTNNKRTVEKEIKQFHNIKIPKSPTTMEMALGPPLETTDNSTTSNRFILVQQPNEIQRKSYKKENRCLLPNPLIICVKDSGGDNKRLPQILDGIVSLKLVNNDGSELPPHKQNALESIEGGLTHPFGEDHTACFSVKVLQTSEGNYFRLVFNISYRLKATGHVEETVVSRPFAVYSNKHNRNARKKPRKEDS